MSFTADMTNFCKNVAPKEIDKTARKILFEIAERVISRSPVGNPTLWKSSPPAGYAGGRFRGNWQYGFNSAPSGELDVIDSSGTYTRNNIKSGVREISGVHYLVNNLPYAERIENGWSKIQAPQGIVGLVELEFDDIVQRAKR